MIRHASLLVASACYLGLIPGAPGTYASVATSLVFYLLNIAGSGVFPTLHLSILGIITILGVLTANEVSLSRGIEDPRIVVIDEVAGQLVALLWLPVTWPNVVLATLAFRVFDVWKPFPIRRSEHLRHGVGIMADDLIAGAYANLLLQLVNASFRG